jgi:branched-subunit amino acid transport protein AzlD
MGIMMIYSLEVIAVVALATLLTRAFPFFAFRAKKQIPLVVQYLGKVLPSAIMAVLVIYCLKNVNFLIGNRGIPEMISVLLVIVLHLWKKNSLISIGGGTLCYMLLIRLPLFIT